MEYNQRNMEIESFAKNYIDTDPKSYTSNLCLLSNMLNVVHVALMQVCIVALPHSPRILLFILLALEILFCLLRLTPYCFHHRFISVVEHLSKIFRSLCLGGFFAVCLIITMLSDPRGNRPVNQQAQSIGIVMIFFGIASSYFFMIIKVIQLILQTISENRKKRTLRRVSLKKKVG